MSAVERTGPTTRIAAVEAWVIVGDKDYVGGGAAPSHRRRPQATPRPRRDRRPPHLRLSAQAQSCLVKITAEDGTVGWGEGHAPLGPRATVAVVQDVLAPLLLGEDPLAIEMLWERMYGSMRSRATSPAISWRPSPGSTSPSGTWRASSACPPTACSAARSPPVCASTPPASRHRRGAR